MLTENTLGNAIASIVCFLIGQQKRFNLLPDGKQPAQEVCIWREHFSSEPAFSKSIFHGSIWTSADIVYSAARISSCKGHFCEEQQELIHRKLNGFFNLAVDSILAFDARIREKSQEELTIITDSIKSGLYKEQTPLKRALRILVKDIQSYIGMPRSVIFDRRDETGQDAHLEWGTANLAVTAVVCRSLREGVTMKEVSGDRLRKSQRFLKEMSAYVSRAELSLLRTAIRQTSAGEDEGKVDDYVAKLREAYGELARNPSRAAALPRLTRTINIAPYSAELGRYLREGLSIRDLTGGIVGCLWPGGNHWGWSYSSQNHVHEVDLSAAFPALEIVAYGLEQDNDSQQLHDAAKIAVAQIRNLLTAGQGSLEGLKNDALLSRRWSIEFLTRGLVQLVHVLRTGIFASNSTLHQEIYECFECLYTALLIRTFQTTVEDRTLPFEVVPQEFVSGNEFAHAPGVDIGLVAYALLVGRELFQARGARESYKQMQEYFERIAGKRTHGLVELPINLPIFSAMADNVRARIVTEYQAEEIARSSLLSSCGPEKYESVVGGFLSSYSDSRAGEYSPKIYTWATAHALLALLEWSRQQGGEQNIAEQLVATRNQLRESTVLNTALGDLSGYLAGYGYPATDDSKGLIWKSLLLLFVNFPLAASVCFYLGQAASRSTSHSEAELFALAAAFCALAAFLIHQFRWLTHATVEIDKALKKGWCSMLQKTCAMNNGNRCEFGGTEKCSFSLEGVSPLATSLRIYLGLYVVGALLVFAVGYFGASSTWKVLLDGLKPIAHYSIPLAIFIVVVAVGGAGLWRSLSPSRHSPLLTFSAHLVRSFRLFWRLLGGTTSLRPFVEQVRRNSIVTTRVERS